MDDADLMKDLSPSNPVTTHPLLPPLNNGTNGGRCRDTDIIKLIGVQYHLTVHVTASGKNNEMITGEVIWLQNYVNKSPGNQPVYKDIFEHYLDEHAPQPLVNTDQFSYVGAFIKATQLRHYRILKRHRFSYNPNFLEADRLGNYSFHCHVLYSYKY